MVGCLSMTWKDDEGLDERGQSPEGYASLNSQASQESGDLGIQNALYLFPTEM